MTKKTNKNASKPTLLTHFLGYNVTGITELPTGTRVIPAGRNLCIIDPSENEKFATSYIMHIVPSGLKVSVYDEYDETEPFSTTSIKDIFSGAKFKKGEKLNDKNFEYSFTNDDLQIIEKMYLESAKYEKEDILGVIIDIISNDYYQYSPSNLLELIENIMPIMPIDIILSTLKGNNSYYYFHRYGIFDALDGHLSKVCQHFCSLV